MTATASSSPAAPQPRDFCRLGDDALRIAALNLLQSSGYAALRRLRCEVTGAVVIVQGVVPSYYLKQLAQTVLQRLNGIRTVRNLVEVRVAEVVQLGDRQENAFPGEAPVVGEPAVTGYSPDR